MLADVLESLIHPPSGTTIIGRVTVQKLLNRQLSKLLIMARNVKKRLSGCSSTKCPASSTSTLSIWGRNFALSMPVFVVRKFNFIQELTALNTFNLDLSGCIPRKTLRNLKASIPINKFFFSQICELVHFHVELRFAILIEFVVLNDLLVITFENFIPVLKLFGALISLPIFGHEFKILLKSVVM